MLKDRFLSVFALAFAAGIAAPFAFGTETKAVSFIVLLCLAAVAVAIYVWAKRNLKELTKIWIYPLIFAVGMACGAGWLCVRAVPYTDDRVFLYREDTVEGIVTESGSSSESSYIECKIERTRVALPQGTRIRLYTDTAQNVHIGDRVSAKLTYTALSYDSQKANRISLIANGTVTAVTEGTGIVTSVRNSFLQACKELYESYGVTGTAQALTVRERTLLSVDVSDAYRNAGLSHLLAISGLHLSILVAALRGVLSVFGMRKRTRELIALLVIVFYCFLTGFSPSVVRASIMLGAVLIGEMTLTESDSLTVLFLALMALLLANPYALLSLGLQLSFLSCLGLLLPEPFVAELQRKIRGRYDVRFYRLRRIAASLVGSLAMTVSAVVFTFPVVMINFGSFSYLSPLTNLVFVPLYSYALALLMLSVPLYPFLPSVAGVIAYLPGQILHFSERALLFLDDRQIGTFQTESLWVYVPVLFSVLSIASMLLFFKKGIRLYLVGTGAFLLSLAVCAVFLPRIPTEILIVSANQSYVYVNSGDGGTFLDLGGENSFSVRDAKADVFTYIVTQTDGDALERLQKALSKKKVRTVYLPLTAEDGTQNDLSLFKALAKEKKCDIIEYYYTAETEDMLFSVHDGTVQTAFDTVVMLYGGSAVPDATQVVLMPAYVGSLLTVSPETLYVPNGYGNLPNGNVNIYDGDFVFAAGEVKTD